VEEEALLIGWQGDTYTPRTRRASHGLAGEATGDAKAGTGGSVAEQGRVSAGSGESEAATTDIVGDVTGGIEMGQEGAAGEARWRQWVETISWKPRAFVYHNFLSHAECDHLVSLGEQRVRACVRAWLRSWLWAHKGDKRLEGWGCCS
jgi:hypothetical protein